MKSRHFYTVVDCSDEPHQQFIPTCRLFRTGQKCETWWVPKRSGIQYWSEVGNLVCSQNVTFSGWSFIQYSIVFLEGKKVSAQRVWHVES